MPVRHVGNRSSEDWSHAFCNDISTPISTGGKDLTPIATSGVDELDSAIPEPGNGVGIGVQGGLAQDWVVATPVQRHHHPIFAHLHQPRRRHEAAQTHRDKELLCLRHGGILFAFGQHMRSAGFFSLGRVIQRVAGGRQGATPWVIAAAFLCIGSAWDWLATGGRLDFILLGLAGYELVIGLTEEPNRHRA